METHALDVGFHWTDLTVDGSSPGTPQNAGTLSYGFQLENGDPGGQKHLRARLNDRLEVRVFELTQTDQIRVENVHIDVVKVDDSLAGSDQGGHLTQLQGDHRPHPPAGKPETGSVGLNALGTAWFVNPVPLDEAGTFLVTVGIRAESGGERRHWAVDPKIIVGRD